VDERHDTARHGIPAVPPAVVASAVDVPAAPAGAARPDQATQLGETPWWRPGPGDVLRVLRWRWVILGPALAVGILLPLKVMVRPDRWFWWPNAFMLVGIGKIILFAWAVVITVLGWGVRNVVRARRDPFCIHCGYSLTGLAEEGQCPECGRLYRPELIAEFKKDPHFFAHRHKMAATHPAEGAAIAAREGGAEGDGTG
jgi:hypothetical protein